MARPSSPLCSDIDWVTFRALLTARVVELGVTRGSLARKLGSNRFVLFYSPRRPTHARLLTWIRKAGLTLAEVRRYAILTRPDSFQDLLDLYSLRRANADPTTSASPYIRPAIQIAGILMEQCCLQGWRPFLMSETDQTQSVNFISILVRVPTLPVICKLEFLENFKLEVQITVQSQDRPMVRLDVLPVNATLIDKVKHIIYSAESLSHGC